jgi:hypothetical protein
MTAANLNIASSGFSSFSQFQAAQAEGDIANEIAKSRAAIDLQNAEAVEEASVEQARIVSKQGIEFLATQKSAAAASGIRINVGSPMVIAAETQAAIAKEKGFALKAGSGRGAAFRASARNERLTGRFLKNRAKLKALAIGVRGAANIAFMGSQIPGKKEPEFTQR